MKNTLSFLLPLSLLVSLLSGCGKETHDPTYHDPVAAAQFDALKKPIPQDYTEARDYKTALNDYNDAIDRRRNLGFMGASCVSGCRRVNKYNANVAPLRDAPEYSFNINPNIPAAE